MAEKAWQNANSNGPMRMEMPIIAEKREKVAILPKKAPTFTRPPAEYTNSRPYDFV